MPVDPVRDAAVDVLLRVFEKDAYIDIAVDRTLRRKGGSLSPRGRRFMTQLVYGTVRHKLLCDSILGRLVEQPLDKLPAPILVILRMGVFQALFCSQVTFPAMVHTSVDLAKKRGHPGTARLTNAVLKRVPKTLGDVTLPDPAEKHTEYLRVRYSIPRWLVELWREEHGNEAAAQICEASDAQAPNTARVNTRLVSRDDLLARLAKSGTAAEAHPDVPDAIVFPDGAVPLRSKAFQEGLFFVQDPASMLPGHLLEPGPGELLLDLCAAPGGKSTHLAQLAGPKSRVVAADMNPRRVSGIMENVERLQLPEIAAVVADGGRPPFAEGTFDRVLVDAPCSGLGTLRRHPDLKWRIRRDSIDRLAAQQEALLRSAVRLCKNGGLIVYSVCTFTGRETEGVTGAVLGDQNVVLENGPEWLNKWTIGQGKYRILPQPGKLDGYFLTRLRKAS